MIRAARRPALLTVVLLHAACTQVEEDTGAALLKGEAVGRVTRLQLRENLKDFAARFSISVKGAAEEILSASPDRTTRVRTVYWQMLAIPSCRRSAVSQDPVAGLIDIWSFCIQLRQYFETHDAFGEATSVAVEVSRALEEDIEAIARESIPEAHFERARVAVHDFASTHRVEGTFAWRSARPALVRASGAKSLEWIADLPFTPFRLFLDEHAKAIREFALVADSLMTYSESLPDVLRWQMQLLLYDLESLESTKSAVANLTRASGSMESFAETARELPETLRQQLTGAVKEVASELGEVRETLEQADKTLTSASGVASTLERTTANWLEAGGRWEKAVAAFDGVVKVFTEEPDAAARPASGTAASADDSSFDIKNYTETAARAEAAATRLESLTGAVKHLLESDAIGKTLNNLVLHAAILLVIFFGLLLAYRVSVARLARAPPPEVPSAASSAARVDERAAAP